MKLKLFILVLIYTNLYSTLKSQPGTLDKSFAKNGKELVSSGNAANSVISTPDGKILVGGASPSGFYSQLSLSRYNSNGSFDKTFNHGKINSIYVDSNLYSSGIVSMGIRSDGKIIAVGNGNRVISISRYNEDGTTDSLFGINGVAIIECKRYCTVGAMVVLPQNKILICGSSRRTYYDTVKPFLLRINENGRIDRTFGDTGFVTANVSPYYDGGFNALTIQQDQQIIAVGKARYFNANNNFLTARFKPNGKPDSSFGSSGNGTVVTSLNNNDSYAVAVTALSNGRIIVGGTSYGGMAVVKYFHNGYLDYTFNSNGSAINYFTNEYVQTKAMVVESNKKIILCGIYGSEKGEALSAFDADGNTNAYFGNDGYVLSDFEGSLISNNAMALQADGKIIIAGSAYNEKKQSWSISLSRYYGDVSAAKEIKLIVRGVQNKMLTTIKAEY